MVRITQITFFKCAAIFLIPKNLIKFIQPSVVITFLLKYSGAIVQ